MAIIWHLGPKERDTNQGVNDVNKRKLIKALIRSQIVDLVCLQETKMQELSLGVVCSIGEGRFLEWGAVNARGAAGGVVVLWDYRVQFFLITTILYKD